MAHCGCNATIDGKAYTIDCDGSNAPTCTCTVDGSVVRTFAPAQPMCNVVCATELPTLADDFTAANACGFPSP